MKILRRFEGRSSLMMSLLILLLGFSELRAEEIAGAVGVGEATDELRLQAQSGDPEAQEAYAVRLEAGQFHVEASKWFRKAAESGRSEAQFRLGMLLLNGRPAAGPSRPELRPQPWVAISWLTKAAEQDHKPAQLELGRCMRDGVGTSRNPVEALKWLLLATDEGSAVARSEKDRTALSLTAGQIEKAQQRADAFRNGDRSDPRIVIVTQADLARPKEVATAEPVAAEEIVITPEQEEAETQGSVSLGAVSERQKAEDPFAWWLGEGEGGAKVRWRPYLGRLAIVGIIGAGFAVVLVAVLIFRAKCSGPVRYTELASVPPPPYAGSSEGHRFRETERGSEPVPLPVYHPRG